MASSNSCGSLLYYLLLLTFSFITAQASSNIAVLVKNPLSRRNSESRITVFKSANQSVTFEKAIVIGNSLDEQRFEFSESNAIQYGDHEDHASRASLILPANVDAAEKAGIYRIRVGISNGPQEEQVQILLLNEKTSIIPDVTSMVVEKGANATLAVSVSSGYRTDKLRWRRDGVFYAVDDGCTGATCSVLNAEHSHVYECFTAGQYSENNHAIMNVIVRECDLRHWGLDCNGECPRCFNGGVCSDRGGVCQCPPGFSGQHCELVHGRNVFGQHGEYRCDTELAVHNNSCQGALICYPDPFGCVCPSGYSGIDCANECEIGKFGANCLQDCHCSKGSNCSRDTGICSNSICADGWKGVNCQVEDPCSIGIYGDLCTQPCSCSHGDCQEVEDKCSRGCAIPWTGAACQNNTGEGRLEPMDIVRGNPGFPTIIRCTLVKNPILEDQTKLVVTFLNRSLSSIGHTIHERRYELTKTWNLTLENPGKVECCIRDTALRSEMHLAPAELPAFTSSQLPFLSSDVSATTIKVSWRKWTEDTDDGDGPIWGYKIKCTGDDLEKEASVPESFSSYTFSGLSPENAYNFVIAVVREGAGGVGKYNNLTTLKTSCAVPDGPINVSVEFHGNDEELLMIRWGMPNTHSIRCNSGVSHLTIYYSRTERPEMAVVESITNVNSTLYTLKVPTEAGTYILQMSLTTAGESEKSSPLYFSISSALPLPYVVAIWCTSFAIIVLLVMCLVGFIFHRRRSDNAETPENIDDTYEAPCEKHDDFFIGDAYNKYQDHCFSSLQQDEYEIPKEQQQTDELVYETASLFEQEEGLYTNTSF